MNKIKIESKSKNRNSDKLIKLYLKNDSEQYLLVHIEIQGYFFAKKESEYLLDENIEISYISVEKLKLLFGFSSEHSFDGSYKLTEGIIDNLKNLINYNFLPDKFDYIIGAYNANYD
ncbi:MAG: hypothetical protein U0354_19025 [Candidatus Sericytochromatia bacterium]